jgi:hypothetical protein
MDKDKFYAEAGVFSQKVAPKLAEVLMSDAAVKNVDFDFAVKNAETGEITITIEVKVG